MRTVNQLTNLARVLSMNRSDLLELLVSQILVIEHERPLLVAIDGVDAAGKTTLAAELSKKLRELGLNIIEASIDGFHNPRVIRYKQGAESPEGYYNDSFNLAALQVLLLDPLKTGDLRYKARAFDYIADRGVVSPFLVAEPDSILVFDGVFAHRAELRDYWDYSIYLHIDEAQSLRRGVDRGQGDEDDLVRRYEKRYISGQRLYLADADPMNHADIVIDNNDFESPTIMSIYNQN